MYIRHFSDEDIERIVDLYVNQKMAINKIACIFNAGDKTIAKVLYAHKVV